MRYSRADINRIEGKFDSFCKTVLKNRARDWYRKKERQQKREILFSDVSPGLHIEPSCFDYIMCIECQAFYALDRMVMIENDLLAKPVRKSNKTFLENPQHTCKRVHLCNTVLIGNR